MIRYAEALNQGLHRLMKEDEKIYLVGEDLLDPYGGAFKVAKGLSTEYPSRVITTPISEAAITGFCNGLALRGFKPILEVMFGDFLALCMDQIVNHAAKLSWMYNENANVPIVIRAPMGARRGYGPTHSQSIETLLLNVPLLKLIAPSLYHDAGEMLYETVKNAADPIVFIENKLNYSERLLAPDSNGKIGSADVCQIAQFDKRYPTISLQYGSSNADVVLISYGGMATFAAKAAETLFLKEEINVRVLIPSFVKPFPLNDILLGIGETRRVVIAEESNVAWGWSSELSCQLSENFGGEIEIRRVGSKETPIPASIALEKQTISSVKDIENAVASFFDERIREVSPSLA